MTDKLLDVLDRIAENRDRPTSLKGFIEYAPDAGSAPPPQITWPLLGLIHCLGRKLWAWGVIRNRLGSPLLGGLAESEAGTLNVRGCRSGVVPGLPDWRYALDANDGTLTHRGTGEDIQFETYNGPELIDEGWFIHHFASHRDPGPAERRLARLFPRGDSCFVALDVLRTTGLLHDVSDGVFTLCGRVTAYSAAVERFLARWQQDPAARPWLAALIGDWPAAHEAALALGDSALADWAAPRAERSRRRWRKRLRTIAARQGLDDDLLVAIADAGDDDLPRYVERALTCEWLSATAIEIVHDDPRWCARVHGLLTSTPAGRRAFSDRRSARYLGRHAYQVEEVIRVLMGRERPDWRVLLELALTHAPDRLPDFLPRALRSAQEGRLDAGAILAVLDTPWSRHVLEDAVNSTDCQDRSYEARAALRECRGGGGARTARAWEQHHPEETPAAPRSDRFGYALDGIRKILLDRMTELADPVQAVRNRLPQG